MARPKYPERWKRERMLHFVYEWMQENQTPNDLVPMLTARTVNEWGEKQEGLNGAQAMLLFKQLVEEKAIFLVHPLDTKVSGFPWLRAYPQYLSKWALMEIGELDDPDRELAAMFQAALERIKSDTNIPQSQQRD